MPYIVSTMSASVDYCGYENVHSGAAELTKKVTINGGHGVADMKHALANAVLTPNGVVTNVSDEDLDFLKNHKLFQKHVDGGYITVTKMSPNTKKVVKDMENTDDSSPLTEADFTKGGRAFLPGRNDLDDVKVGSIGAVA